MSSFSRGWRMVDLVAQQGNSINENLHNKNYSESNIEIQNEKCDPVKMNMEVEILSKSTGYFEETNTDTIKLQNETSDLDKMNTENEIFSETTGHFEETNEDTIAKSILTNIQRNKSLVPYDESDLSDNEDNITQLITTEAANKSEGGVPQSFSSSSSSSSSTSSSSSSSSSSSDSDSEGSQSTQLIYPMPHPVTKTSNTHDEIDENEDIENTPLQQLNMDSILNESRNRRSRETINNQNYQISPLYTDESEVNLSDTDPTFLSIEPTRKRNYFVFQSCSSSTSSLDSDEVESSPHKNGRKRSKNSLKWKQNIVKRMRNKGKSYVSMSKSKKNIPARCLKEPCTEKCRLKCTQNINTDSRYEIFQKFWDFGDLAKQRAYISSCMIDIEPKYKYTNAEKPRRNNKAFYFVIDNFKTRVCKHFFKSTLDISDRLIFTVQTKANENGFAHEDLRGRHRNHRKIDPQLRTDIKKHINSIPRIESHYLRASTSREYIEGSKTIKNLYSDYILEQQQHNKESGTYNTYYKIFTTEFNLGFFQPKKDQCDLCNAYYNSNADQKTNLDEKYKTHIEEKSYSRTEKLNHRKKVNKDVRVAVYDLEAVLQCPKGDISSFYYKSILNCYNLTLTELAQKESKVAYENVHCYFWTECDAKRGAVEIGSCIWEYMKAVTEQDDDEKEFIFYSDNYCGQNKNKYIASLYLFAVQTLNIKSITHKFLIRGHTQNEADSVHSLIEKEVRKNLKSGPIYTPDQYIALIKNAKKTKPALSVHEQNFESFYDLKKLQEEWGYNFTTNTDGETVNWNNTKVLKIIKENATNFFYKTSYKEESYKEVNVRNKRKKMNPTGEVIPLKIAYTTKQELSASKKKDLKELLSKALIPSYYAGFYNSII